uniref:Ovule protein n=1 Tax=Steinernema glaseri TaxID=37863 RepID=A0A1I7YKK3_9BILA
MILLIQSEGPFPLPLGPHAAMDVISDIARISSGIRDLPKGKNFKQSCLLTSNHKEEYYLFITFCRYLCG